jgi:hypothetical protein
MATSPAPKPTKRLLVEIGRTSDHRLEGRARGDTAGPWLPFSGVLELLKVLGDLSDDDSNPTTLASIAASGPPSTTTKSTRDEVPSSSES